ncbi:hypothetical protein SAMN06298211_10874 [Prevotellaceae bacterium MN60]|nr:hypothetical protein SAMN06298211_10874 [Prevotellaceae bacterium MN60]
MKRTLLLTMLSALFSIVAFAEDDVLITPPETATVETYYTISGNFYIYGNQQWEDATADMPTIKVAFDGSDIYIQGLAFWFKEAWIKGTIADGKATFTSGQYLGADNYGKEYLVGSEDGHTVTDIIFNYDSTEGILTAINEYIFENGKTDAVSAYTFWNKPTFSKTPPPAPEVVTVPETLVAEEYAISYTDFDGHAAGSSVKVGFDGTDVYIQGFCATLPEAWIKGTMDGNTITFAGGQYYGKYSSYELFLQDNDVVLTYDEVNNTLTATGLVYNQTGNSYADYYKNPVIKKVVEKIATPATPTISAIKASGYGDVVRYNVPPIDVNGDGLVSSKLSFQFYTDVEQEINPLTFTTDYFSKLTEDMTVIPYGFTEDYDFYNNEIYLNMPHSTWNKIGIQSIYTGGGEEKKSEIFWYTIKEYGGNEGGDTEDITIPAGIETSDYVFSANALENGREEATPREAEMKVAFDGNDVYFQGFVVDLPEKWAKGTLSEDGKTVTIPSLQYLGQQNIMDWFIFDYYLTAVDAEGHNTDIVFNYDADTQKFTTNQTIVLTDKTEPYWTFTNVVIAKPGSTGIEHINTTKDNKDTWYNLNGVRIAQPTEKGLYIHNGRKVMLR